MNNEKLNELLLTVRKPGRYVGGEWNSVRKEWTPDRVKFLLAFPDAYEIGMSNLGMKILYGILNGRDDCLCERVFSPWDDFETVLRTNCLDLFSLESRHPPKDFDIIGFSLAYELTYTNVVNILDLGGVTKLSSERRDTEPLVIAGGPAVFNPEPMADFIDAFVIGDGEDAICDIVEAYKTWRKSDQGSRVSLLKKLSRIPGVYVPSLYAVEYGSKNTISRFYPKEEGVGATVQKRTVEDLDSAFYPVDQIVPNVQVTHDRMAIEIMRGCNHACSFCQATAIYRPRRERSIAKILEIAKKSYAMTGYDEISLLSLSSVDHPGLKGIVEGLNCEFAQKSVSIAVPSLRIEDALKDLPVMLSKVARPGLTFAPESGSERIRRSVNKNIDMDKLFLALSESFKAGWRRVKLYFMIGLPGEDAEDVAKIAELIYKVSDARRAMDGKNADVTASINSFIPKPHTPLEREAMDSVSVLDEKKSLIRGSIKSRFVSLDFHSFDMSFLEAVFARGDRRLGRAILEAWKRGSRFEGWTERFNFALWQQVFKDAGIDPAFYATRKRPKEEILPWSFINCSVK